MLINPRHGGFTLIEMLVTLSVIGILLSIGAPSFSNWMKNTQVKAVAESILTGMQLARAEAVRQNVRVQLSLTGTSSSATGGWIICAAPLQYSTAAADAGCNSTYSKMIQKTSGNETAKNARLGVSTASTQNYGTALSLGAGLPAAVIFTPMGRTDITATNIARVDVDWAEATYVASNHKRQVIIVSQDGQVKLCDPTVSLPNPRGCS